MLTTNQKGAIAEAAVMQEAIDLGLGVWLPFAEEPYDLILDLRPGLLRVQCKQAVLRGDVINIGTCVAAAIGTDCSSASTSRTRSTSSRPTAPIPTAATCSRTSCRSTGRPCSCGSSPQRTTRYAASGGLGTTSSGYTDADRWAHSSVGRARGWQPRGRRFEPGWVHSHVPARQRLPVSAVEPLPVAASYSTPVETSFPSRLSFRPWSAAGRARGKSRLECGRSSVAARRAGRPTTRGMCYG